MACHEQAPARLCVEWPAMSKRQRVFVSNGPAMSKRQRVE
jgi:hypothetical protein